MEKFVESLKGKEITFDIYFEPGREVMFMSRAESLKVELGQSTKQIKQSLEEGVEAINQTRKEMYKTLAAMHKEEAVLVGQLRAMQLSEEMFKV
jgi:hypothetical protein